MRHQPLAQRGVGQGGVAGNAVGVQVLGQPGEGRLALGTHHLARSGQGFAARRRVSGCRLRHLVRRQMQHHGGFQGPAVEAVTQFLGGQPVAGRRRQSGIGGLDHQHGVAAAQGQCGEVHYRLVTAVAVEQ